MAQKGLVDLYAALDVQEDADEAAIKRSYRILVLKWHPDKNPSDRQKAEERIRLINTAYGTLSNPAKRERYDLQRCAMDKKRRGMAPSKPRVSPKMSAPKEFMIQPMGHPEKFVRQVDKKHVQVQSRQDVEADVDEFFQQAKMSLWWLPEVNNMCRIRTVGSKARGDKKAAAAGLAGGLNLSFRVKANYESEVVLAAAGKGQKSSTVDFIAKASPEYEGAFRFETACCRGHYLAFFPPSDLRVAPFLNEDASRALDFTLVDFSAKLNFKDLEEVLLPLGKAQMGKWLPLTEIRQNEEVCSYFHKVLQKPVWETEDFVAYFEGHWADWEYRAEEEAVRLRPPEERLTQVLSSAELDDVKAAVRQAGEELPHVALHGLARAAQLLAERDSSEELDPWSAPAELVELRRKLLAALEACLGVEAESGCQALPLRQLLTLVDVVPALVGRRPTVKDLDNRSASMQHLSDAVVARIARGWSELRGEDVPKLLKLPRISEHDEVIREKCASVFGSMGGELLLQVIQAAVTRGCSSLAGAALRRAVEHMEALGPSEGSAFLETLARTGVRPDEVAILLRKHAANMSAASLAAAVLALAEHGAGSRDFQFSVACLAGHGQLAELGQDILLAMALASAKNPALRPLFSAVAEASLALPLWTPATLTNLLLAMAKGREHVTPSTIGGLLQRAEEIAPPALGGLPAAELMKLVLAIVGLGSSALLDRAAHTVVERISEFSQAQLLLITQAIAQGPGGSGTALWKVLEEWPSLLASLAAAPKAVPQAPPVGTKAKPQAPPPAPSAVPPGRGQGFLTVEQQAKLALAVAPALREAGKERSRETQRLTAALCEQLARVAGEVPPASRALLEAELNPGGSLGRASGREELRAALQVAARAEKRAARSRSRSLAPHRRDRTQPKKKKRRR